MAVYFASDHHFNHAKIISFNPPRPFKSVEEMNEKMIYNHNDVVKPDDEVWFLGDFGMGNIEDSLDIVKRMNGRKKLIAGNHDRVHTSYYKGNIDKEHEWMLRYMDAGFIDIMHSTFISFGGSVAQLCHFPPTGDSGPEDRYSEYRPKEPYGPNYLIHGHTHSTQMVQPNKRNQIHVGVDATGYVPVSKNALEALLPYWKENVWK